MTAKLTGKVALATGGSGGIGAARDLGPRGITVNRLQPGSIDTDMHSKEGGESPKPGMRNTHRSATGRQRRSQPVSCFSPAPASFVTGTVLNVESGFSA
jgi:3-oxoacyl-[acyl-carrier protein] reductase